MKIQSHSFEETIDLGRRFAGQLKKGAIVCLKGDLGAGKTVFAKGVAQGLGLDPHAVNSPTFVLMNYYPGKLSLYHFDLYRLEKPEELASVNFDEYFYGNGICLVEWPERLGEALPKNHWLVELTHKNENERDVCISYPSNPQQKFSL